MLVMMTLAVTVVEITPAVAAPPPTALWHLLEVGAPLYHIGGLCSRHLLIAPAVTVRLPSHCTLYLLLHSGNCNDALPMSYVLTTQKRCHVPLGAFGLSSAKGNLHRGAFMLRRLQLYSITALLATKSVRFFRLEVLATRGHPVSKITLDCYTTPPCDTS